MNRIVFKDGKYYAHVQEQDCVETYGPFDTEQQARNEWARVSNLLIDQGKKPDDPPLYESILITRPEEVLVRRSSELENRCPWCDKGKPHG